MHFGNFGHFPLKKKYTSSKGNAQLDPPVCCLPEGERQLGVLFPEPQLDPCLFSGWEENLSRSQIFAFGWDSFLGSFEGSITGHQTRQPDSLGDQEDLRLFCVPLEPPPSPRTEPQKDDRMPDSVIHWVNNYLLTTYCGLGFVLGSRDSLVKKVQSPYSREPGYRQWDCVAMYHRAGGGQHSDLK